MLEYGGYRQPVVLFLLLITSWDPFQTPKRVIRIEFGELPPSRRHVLHVCRCWRGRRAASHIHGAELHCLTDKETERTHSGAFRSKEVVSWDGQQRRGLWWAWMKTRASCSAEPTTKYQSSNQVKGRAKKTHTLFICPYIIVWWSKLHTLNDQTDGTERALFNYAFFKGLPHCKFLVFPNTTLIKELHIFRCTRGAR